MKANKHSLQVKGILGFALGIIGLVVLFQILAALYPTLTSAGETLNSSGFPLGELFADTGAIWYILAAVVIVAVVSFVKMNKR